MRHGTFAHLSVALVIFTTMPTAAHAQLNLNKLVESATGKAAPEKSAPAAKPAAPKIPAPAAAGGADLSKQVLGKDT